MRLQQNMEVVVIVWRIVVIADAQINFKRKIL